MRSARRLTVPLLAAIALVSTLVTPASAALAESPTVAIASPTTGATATGLVSVTVNGNVDPSEIATASTILRIDGLQYGLAKPCGNSASVPDCPTTFTWDATGSNGPHTIEAVLYTDTYPVGTKASVAVNAVSPAPTATIVDPKPNAAVHGTLTVNAAASVDLSQSDPSASFQLWVDGLKYGLPATCTLVATTAKTCAVSFTVHQPTWSGQHTVQVAMTTASASVTSATVPYFAYSAAKLFLSRVTTVHSGKLAVIRGRAIAVNSGAPLVGAKVTVLLAPATGKKHTLVVHTGATGRFSLATKLGVNTKVTVTVVTSPGYGSSHGSVSAGVLAPILCKADLTVRHGRFDSGTCTVAHLPNGTKVALQYQSTDKKWHVLGAGTTSGTTIPISFQFGKAGRYPVRLVLGANKAYLATYGTPFVVTVT